MDKDLKVISYTLAAIAGICFVQGLAILAQAKGMVKRGQGKGCRNHT